MRDGNNEIYVMDVDGRNVRRLTNHEASDSADSWSPDGLTILFSSNRDGNNEIYRVNVDGTNLQRLTNNETDDIYPVIAPNGQEIAFISDRDGSHDIYVMNVNGDNVRRLTTNGVDVATPAWSPDSRLITFVSNRNLYVMNDDGGANRLLIDNGSDPTWSSDGRQIAFTTFRDGNGEIYAIDVDGTNLRRLTNNAAFDWLPKWQPLLGQVSVSSPDMMQDTRPTLQPPTPTPITTIDVNSLSSITVANAAQLRLLETIPVGVLVDVSGISADRSAIVVGSNNTATRGFFVLDLNNLRLIEIPNTFDDFRGIVGEPEIAISPDGRYMAYPLSDEIAVYSFMEQRIIANLTGHTDTIHALTFSPSGSMLASAGSDESIIIWNTSTWRSMMTLAHNDLLDVRADTIWSLAFAPNEGVLLSGTYANVDFWDLNTGQLVTNVNSDFFDVFSSGATDKVMFIPNTTYMAMVSNNERIELWDLQNLRFYDSFEVNSSIFDINQSGSLLVAEGSTGFEVYDLFSTRTLFSSTTRFASKYYFALNDRVLVVITYSDIQLWGVQ